MRAPVEVMTSAACVDYTGPSPKWDGAANDLAAQGSQLDHNIGLSFASWRANSAQKLREKEELDRSQMGKNVKEINHLRQVFLEGTAKKRAESQSKAKQEQPSARLPVGALQSTTAKLDSSYAHHHLAAATTAPLTHFDESGKVSPRARGRTQDRKRKLPAATEESHSWVQPPSLQPPTACMQQAYFAAHSQQMSMGNGIGPTDNICEDSLRHLMFSNGDSNFHSVGLDDIDRVLLEAEQTVQDDHLPLGASSSSLHYESAMQQQSHQQVQLQQHQGLRLPHFAAQQHPYGVPAPSPCTLPTVQHRLPGGGNTSFNYGSARPAMMQQSFASSTYLPSTYPNYGHPPAATVRWGSPDLHSNLPFIPEPNGQAGAIRPSYGTPFGYAQRLQ